MPRFQVYACVAAVFAIIWAAAVTTVSGAQPGRIDEDFSCIPMEIGKWHGENLEKDIFAMQILSTTSILSRQYTNDDGEVVVLSIVYGRELSDFHQPEVCMKGAGWKTTKSELIWLEPKGMPRHQARLLTISSDYDDGAMAYWYYMGGKVTPDVVGSKINLVLKSMCGIKLKPSVMVKFTAMGDTDVATSRKSAEELSELLGKSIVDMAKKKPVYKTRAL